MTPFNTVHPKLLKFGDSILYKTSEEVGLPTDTPLVKQILKLMNNATQHIVNIGIAAPQIGILKRIVVFEVPAEHPRYKTDGIAIPRRILLNPSYEPLSEEQNFEWEACLSVPEMMGQVSRYTHIKYQYIDLEGNHHVCEASHLHARIVQHEVDHLDGILYPLRIKNLRAFGFRDEVLSSSLFLENNSL